MFDDALLVFRALLSHSPITNHSWLQAWIINQSCGKARPRWCWHSVCVCSALSCTLDYDTNPAWQTPGPRVLSVCTHCFHTMHVCWDFSIPYQCISCIYHCVWMCGVSLKCQLCNTSEERWRDRERRMIGWYQWYQSISIIVPHGQCINISSELRMCDVRPLQMLLMCLLSRMEPWNWIVFVVEVVVFIGEVT